MYRSSCTRDVVRSKAIVNGSRCSLEDLRMKVVNYSLHLARVITLACLLAGRTKAWSEKFTRYFGSGAVGGGSLELQEFS
jgi:hypothetical protein